LGLKCPRCACILESGVNKGDWTTFICWKCGCLFTVANSDLDGMYIEREPKEKEFNPSMRFSYGQW